MSASSVTAPAARTSRTRPPAITRGATPTSSAVAIAETLSGIDPWTSHTIGAATAIRAASPEAARIGQCGARAIRTAKTSVAAWSQMITSRTRSPSGAEAWTRNDSSTSTNTMP